KSFAREDKGETQLASIENILEGVLIILAGEVRVKADIIKEYENNLPQIRCSEHRLGQVFINILMNATQAIPEYGVIKIKTYRRHSHICVEITDTGSGIADDDMRKIFDPFYTTKPVRAGRG
ncbi:MAG: hypothetical protein K8I00_09660, partial [Candidatus Omnitrophica bacterium]|nr:hypothetical protein [Candidatus Omnitrophota bacterium]